MRTLLRSALALAILFCTREPSGAAQPASREGADGFTRSPYVQFATPTMTHVVWRTAGPILPIVRFGTELNSLPATVPVESIVRRASLGTATQVLPPRWASLRTPENLKLPKLHSAPVGTFQYEARLSGLKPSTVYYYGVFDGNRRLTPADPSYSFTTPPVVGTRQPVRFGVIGDSGTGRLPQAEVFQALLEHVRQTGPKLDFWIHVGDMAYNVGRDMEFQTHVFAPYDALMRNTVCWPTMGNHEGSHSKGTTGIGPYYDAYIVPTRGEAGGVASGTEAYYSFDFANIHFICLDSHDLDRKPGGAMARWLRADLDKANAEWLIAFWHHPAYTKGSHDSDKEKDLTEMRQYIMPIVEAGGVDLVLNGHSHTYERSMLIDGAYATPTVSENVVLDDGDGDPNGDGAYQKSAGLFPHQGLVEVVAGNGGQTLGRTGSMPIMKKIFVEHGSVLVEVNGDTLTAQMVNRVGTVRDLFSIAKRGVVTPRRLALPWQPPAYVKPEVEPKLIATAALQHRVLIPKGAPWSYLSGDHPQGAAWTSLEFNAANWKAGSGAFGFGDGQFATHTGQAAGRAPAIYLRKEFQIPQADAVTELGLQVDYSDGLIAYLNGQEVARLNVGRSSGSHVQAVKARGERGSIYLPLKDAHQYLRDGTNVLALEAHANPEAIDFWLDPVLVSED